MTAHKDLDRQFGPVYLLVASVMRKHIVDVGLVILAALDAMVRMVIDGSHGDLDGRFRSREFR